MLNVDFTEVLFYKLLVLFEDKLRCHSSQCGKTKNLLSLEKYSVKLILTVGFISEQSKVVRVHEISAKIR